MKKDYHKNIKDYYDQSLWLYRIFCADSNNFGMHFGIWNKTTINRSQAINNQNKIIIDLADIKPKDKILDAGCGMGGSAVYIVKKTGAKVWGITLTKNQIKQAQNFSKINRVDNLTNFSIQNFENTQFPNNFFDAVFGIESICHASPKSVFLKEAKRILKPGGKLIIQDGYLARDIETAQEQRLIEEFKEAFALNEFIKAEELTKQLMELGFVNIKNMDKTRNIKPSVKYFYKLAKATRPFTKLLGRFPIKYLKALARNNTAIFNSGIGYKNGLASYFIHYAEKPEEH